MFSNITTQSTKCHILILAERINLERSGISDRVANRFAQSIVLTFSIDTLLSCIRFFSSSARLLLDFPVSRVWRTYKFHNFSCACTPINFRNSASFSSSYLLVKRCRKFLILTIPRGSFSIFTCLMSGVWRLDRFSIQSGSDLTFVCLKPM